MPGTADKLLLMMTVILVASGGTASAYDRDVGEMVYELDKKVEKLDEKVDKISDDVNKLTKFTAKVEKALDVVRGVAEVSASSTTETSSLPIIVQELRREPFGHGEYRYVVRYIKNSEKIIASALILPERKVKPEVVVIDYSNRIEEASVLNNITYKELMSSAFYSPTDVEMSFYNQDMTSCITFSFSDLDLEDGANINKDIALAPNEFEVPRLDFSLEKGVYEVGHDIEVKLFTGPDDRNEIDTKYYLYDLEKREFLDSDADLKEFFDGFGKKQYVNSTTPTDVSQKHAIHIHSIAI